MFDISKTEKCEDSTDSVQTNKSDYQLLTSNQKLLFSSFKDLNLDSIKTLINSNTDLIQSIIEKCRKATPLLYSGQQRDMYREERAKIYINSSFVATAIQPDGNCLYRTISMRLFGNEDFHIQLRLATIYFVLKFDSYFYEFLCKSEGVTSRGKLIQHIEIRFHQMAGVAT